MLARKSQISWKGSSQNMLDMTFLTVMLVILFALLFDFINGFHDTANSIATSVSTRILPPMVIVFGAACFNFLGALLGTNVAKTITKDIVSTNFVLPQFVILAAIFGAITWNLITWYFGIPSSSSHALLSSLVGATIVHSVGFQHVNWSGVIDKVILPLLASPIIGFVLGFIFMKILFKIFAKATQTFVNRWFSKLQIISAMLMALMHGTNDSQKSMGIITLALISAKWGNVSHNNIPLWVIVACAIAMGLGTSIGGWRIIKTMGVNMIKLQPINGFAAETAAAAVIGLATNFNGAPVSTTHIISSAIMGVGSAKRLSAVRWVLARNIVWAWILTIPISAVFGAIFTFLLSTFLSK
jgi:inorganic phosphate transporter, PiT family